MMGARVSKSPAAMAPSASSMHIVFINALTLQVTSRSIKKLYNDLMYDPDGVLTMTT